MCCSGMEPQNKQEAQQAGTSNGGQRPNLNSSFPPRRGWPIRSAKMNPKSVILLIIFTHGLWADEPKPFFPVSEDGGKDTISTFEHEWYLKHLRAMKESSLFSKRGDKTQDIYRFTLLPTWGNLLSSVVTKSGDRATIQFTRLDGQGGYEPGKVAEKEQRDLTEKELKDFLAKFDALDFADQSTNDPFIGLDGSE